MRYGLRVRTAAGVLCVVLFACIAVVARAQNPPTGDGDVPPPEPDWPKLQAAYAYDAKKDLAAKEEKRDAPFAYAVHLEFTGANNATVTGAFLRPKADGVYPVVLLLHGLKSDKEYMLKEFGIPLVSKGFAVLALDAPHHGERKSFDDDPAQLDKFGNTLHDGCLDYRRALDWLTTRKDVDMKRVGLIGYNMGAMIGVILGGVDDRIKGFVLCVGGDPIIAFIPNVPYKNRDGVYSVCPVLFIAHISPRPVLMLNAKLDETLPYVSSMRLFEAARDPKEQIWYDSGHVLPAKAVNKSVQWIEDKLKVEDKKP